MINRLRTLLCVLFFGIVCPLGATSTVDSLRIDILLEDDGTAHVTEVWHIDVSDDITEWYLVADNLGRMDIRNLQVSDESGAEYFSEGTSWNIERSRQAKARRCGLVRKSDGYEICWGIGSSGPHVYEVRYDLTGLVKSFSDSDGFNHMFVTRGLASPPNTVLLTIRKSGKVFTSEETKVWGFGFNGRIDVLDGAIKAWSTEPFTSRSALIAMVCFPKGIFTPALQDSRSFEEVQAAAFEDSNYYDDSSSGGSGEGFFKFIFAVFVLITGYGIFTSIKNIVRTRRRKKELLGGKSTRNQPWFRDVPVNGNLRDAYDIIRTFENPVQGLEQLISAYLTRLFYKGAFSIVPQSMGKPAFKINDYDPGSDASVDQSLEARMFGFIKAAAGSDSILQQKELKRWASSHGKELYQWQKDVPGSKSVWNMEASDVQQVFGLRKFLEDFTLIEDRGVVEVKLWNNYLIFASLYGIADQVYKDFKKVCPEYFQLARMQTIETGQEFAPNVIWNTIGNTSRYMNTSAANYAGHISDSTVRWSGGGGMTSFGGGGGFTGGGHGGGGR